MYVHVLYLKAEAKIIGFHLTVCFSSGARKYLGFHG
jgi:hypothetical protein